MRSSSAGCGNRLGDGWLLRMDRRPALVEQLGRRPVALGHGVEAQQEDARADDSAECRAGSTERDDLAGRQALELAKSDRHPVWLPGPLDGECRASRRV